MGNSGGLYVIIFFVCGIAATGIFIWRKETEKEKAVKKWLDLKEQIESQQMAVRQHNADREATLALARY
jgi:nicotinamide riboside transporter PnuC